MEIQISAISIDTIKSDVIIIPKPKGFGIRHLQLILLFTGFIFAASLMINLSVGIVAIVDPKSNPDFDHYDWSESIRGFILSSFFWGNAISIIPSGILVRKYGAKILIFIGIIVSAILTLLTPLACSFGWEYLCASRAIQGLFQGCTFPCVHALLSKWIHPSERGFATAFVYIGVEAGVVIMMAVSGVIASSSLGWPGVFYIPGVCTLCWCFFWFWYGKNSPDEYSTISKGELNYIASVSSSSSHRLSDIPWKQIFTSKPFLALLIAQGAQNWGYLTLLTEMPSYMHAVMDFDIDSSAVFSSLPYLVAVIAALVLSELSDFLMRRGSISTEFGRKLFNTIGQWVPIIFLISLGYVSRENVSLAIAMLTIATGINAAVNVGYLVNHMDLSPNFAGTLMGLAHGITVIIALFAPILVGFIVHDPADPALWRIVFFITSGVFFFGNLVFIIFGKGTIQSWNVKEIE